MKNLWRRHPGVRTGDKLTFGERAADHMKSVLATWTALIAFGGFMAAWMVWNSHLGGGKNGWDPYPWILLNLMLSSIAGLQCFVLLIAAKRADQIAAEVATHTLNNTEQLTTLLETNTQLTEQVASLTKQVHDHITKEAKAIAVVEEVVEKKAPVKRAPRRRKPIE